MTITAATRAALSNTTASLSQTTTPSSTFSALAAVVIGPDNGCDEGAALFPVTAEAAFELVPAGETEAGRVFDGIGVAVADAEMDRAGLTVVDAV
jgi:hypothetical protein